MKFEITGTVKNNPEAVEVPTKAGSSFTKKLLIVEVVEQNKDKQFTNLVAFDVTGEKTIEFSKSLKVGDEVTVSFSVSSREHNGSYYTSIRAFNIAVVSSATPINDSMDAQQPEADGLPF